MNSLASRMYQIWLIFDPRLVLVGLAAFLIFLAVVIHTLLLSTDRFNWLQGVGTKGAPTAVHYVAPRAK